MRVTVLAILPVSMVLGSCRPAPPARSSVAGPTLAAADSIAIRRLWREFDVHWNARDAEGFSDLFTEDGSLYFLTLNRRFPGREAIRQRYNEQFRTYTPDIRHVTTALDIQPIAPGIVLVDGDADIVGHQLTGRSDAILGRQLVLSILVKTRHGWRIRAMRVTTLSR